MAVHTVGEQLARAAKAARIGRASFLSVTGCLFVAALTCALADQPLNAALLMLTGQCWSVFYMFWLGPRLRMVLDDQKQAVEREAAHKAWLDAFENGRDL